VNRTVRFALVAAAPMLAVALSRSPEAFASSPVTHSAGKAATTPAVLTLSVAARPHKPAELTLVSRLRSSSGSGGKSVAFFVVSTEFGKAMEVPIGTAKTAADGTASVRYKPTWSGKEQFVARLISSGAHAPAASASYRVASSTSGPLFAGANPARPLSSVGHIFLRVILTTVALVWLGLIIIVVLAVAWMPRLAGRGID
jgi:hypothetical protein